MRPTILIWGCLGGPGHRLIDAQGLPVTHLRALEPELDYIPPGEQPEGEIHATRIREGWSYVAWWDRRGDPRGKSHTGLLAQGQWTAQQLIAEARVSAPWAIRVELIDNQYRSAGRGG